MKTRIFLSAVLILFLFAGSGLSQTLAPSAAATAPAAAAGKITLDVKGMDIVDVLKMLATRSNISMVVGKNVTGRVTLFLKDVAVEDALEIVLLANDLAYEKKNGILNVMTQRDYELLYGNRYSDKKEAKIVQLKYAKAADISRALNQIKTNIGRIVTDEGSNTIALIDIPEKVKEMEDFIKSTDLPLATQVFGLNYAQAEKLQAKLQETITKGVGSIKIDERTNKIVITDYPEKLRETAKIISAFDERTPQVLIDAQIIEIKPSDKFEMGVDWDYWIEKNFDLKAALPAGTANRLFIGTPATNTISGKGDYKAIVDLLRTIGDTKILSSPRITALNNQEAKILVGTKDAYITSSTSQADTSSVTSQTVNFVDVGIKLYVTPTINRDGFVTMKIKPEISSAVRTDITADGKITQIPIVSTSEAETSVMIKDGLTIIIGGLKKDERSKTVKKIPLLGDIPGIGFLFRSTSDETKTTELVILLTPHIVSAESSYSDIVDLRPKEGMVYKMDKGQIVSEKIGAKTLEKPAVEKQKAAKPKTTVKKEVKKSIVNVPVVQQVSAVKDAPAYFALISEKIRGFVAKNYPKDLKGSVKVLFTLSRDGNLFGEPTAIFTDNVELVPYVFKAIKEASPFEPLPEFLGKDKENFQLNLVYE